MRPNEEIEVYEESQLEDGSWGYFHSLAEPSKSPLTTEQVLRRLEVLGLGFQEPIIARAVAYMIEVIEGDKDLIDPKEKHHDSQVFVDFMLASWILKFQPDHAYSRLVRDQWVEIVKGAFSQGNFDDLEYKAAYERVMNKKARGGRIKDFVNYYHVSLLAGQLSGPMEDRILDHILKHDKGIYYMGYHKALIDLPDRFEGKQTLKYLASIRHLKGFKGLGEKLSHVRDWLLQNQTIEGRWDLGPTGKDKIYMPLQASWRKRDNRIEDSSQLVEEVLALLSGDDQ